MPDAAFGVCLRFVFRFPYGLYGMGIFLAAIVLLVVAIMHMGAGGDGQYDKTRNLTYSHKGTYGTAGFLNPKEAGQVLDFVPDLRKHHGTILGEVDGRVVCIPEKTRFNGNLADLRRERLEKDARVLRQHDSSMRGAEKLAGYL